MKSNYLVDGNRMHFARLIWIQFLTCRAVSSRSNVKLHKISYPRSLPVKVLHNFTDEQVRRIHPSLTTCPWEIVWVLGSCYGIGGPPPTPRRSGGWRFPRRRPLLARRRPKKIDDIARHLATFRYSLSLQ